MFQVLFLLRGVGRRLATEDGADGGDGAVVEVGAEAEGEEPAAVESMLETGGEEGAGLGVAPGEEQAASEGERGREPVAEDDVEEGEGKGAGEDHGPAAGKEELVALKEEGAIEDALRIDRKHGVGQHDDCPEGRMAADEGPLKLRGEAMDGQPEESSGEGEGGEDRREMRRERGSVREASAGEVRIAQKLPERVTGDEPEQRERGDADGREAVGEGERDIEKEELGEEEGAGHEQPSPTRIVEAARGKMSER